MIAFPTLPAQGFKIIFLLILGSTATSSLIPAMGYFIVEGLHQPPWKIGLFSGLVAPLSMLINRQVGQLIDNSVPVRRILAVSVIGYLLFASLLASTPDFLVLVVLGAPLMALSSGATATTLTYGRLYANLHDLDAGQFNALLRMGISIAWMFGPALTFLLISQIGFQKTYLVSICLGLIWLTAWYFIVTRNFRAPPKSPQTEQLQSTDWALWLAALACTFFALGNVLFLSVSPLYFIEQVGLPGFTPGLLLSIKCLVEVFSILFAAHLAKGFGARPVLIAASLLAICSFTLMAQVTTVWQASTIAALEGFYYGLFAGVSITYIQSFIPKTPGRATAIYSNSLFMGGLVGTVSMGMIASAFDYHAVVYVAVGAACMAFIVLMLTRKVPRQAFSPLSDDEI
ncbi:MFS transporter [Roseibium algae]|uniref:MFS transporter n=1 Tax=Roseibium algae TaxID=3123038 RepID=A0ABU8TLC9_9HYPH